MAKKGNKTDVVVDLPETHEVLIEGEGVLVRPGKFWREFQIGLPPREGLYTHVGEDGEGRWIYRRAS